MLAMRLAHDWVEVNFEKAREIHVVGVAHPLEMGEWTRMAEPIKAKKQFVIFLILILAIVSIWLFDFETKFSLVFQLILATLKIQLFRRLTSIVSDGIFSPTLTIVVWWKVFGVFDLVYVFWVYILADPKVVALKFHFLQKKNEMEKIVRMYIVRI